MEQTTKKSKSGLGWLTWVIIWVAGMAGQLAWNIENQWFNTYVYAKIAPDSNIITWMVATSAVVSTIATFLGGTLSDRVGKRRIFVLVGYVMWGVSTIVFGCTQFFGALILESVMVVVFDCVMSFFGSIGNDCGFNPWTTDISTPANRGSLGTAIAIQPVIATIIGSIAFGAIIDGFAGLKTPNGQSLDYFMMFLIVGCAIALIGVFSFFFMKESPTLFPHREVSFGKALAKPFNFKLIKENKLLFWVLMIFMAFFISFNVYFPHILNYFIYSCSSVTWLNESLNLGINTTAGAIMAVGLLLGVPLVIVSGKFLNKQKFIPVLIISVLANILGLAVLFIDGVTGAEKSLQIVLLFLGTFLLGAGYMGLYQALMVWVKDLYPSDMRSQFEGVRMIFYICIPMFLGTLVGNFIIKFLGTPITLQYTSGDGTVSVDGFAPNHWLFLVAMGLALVTFVPIGMAYREVKKNPPHYEGLEEEKTINPSAQ